MKNCVQCDAEFSDERPYDHCMKQECVDAWLIQRRGRMAIDLTPKSGFRPVFREGARG
jgi:hypothetical protein